MESRIDVLVIGVWGYPGRWSLVRYMPPKPPKDIKKWDKLALWKYNGEVIDTHSSTAAFASVLASSGFTTRAVIYGLDTLAASDDALNLEDQGEQLSKDPQDYSDILRKAEVVLKHYVHKYFSEVKLQNDIAEPVIIPGIGSFTPRAGKDSSKSKGYVFTGSPQNMQVKLELDLYDRLRKYKPRAIVLDISHGINFMPVLATMALRRVAKVYSVLSREEVKTIVIISDPITSQNSDVAQDAMIHIVEASSIKVKLLKLLADLVKTLGSEEKYYRMLKSNEPSDELKKLDKVLRNTCSKYTSVAKTLLDAISYGLLLYLVYKLIEIEPKDISSHVEELREHLNRILGARRVEVGEKTIRVIHDFTLNSLVLDAYYILSVLHLLAEEIGSVKNYVREIEGYRMISLKSLNTLAEYVGISEYAKTILNNEVDDVKKRVEKYRTVYGELVKPTPYELIYEISDRALKSRDSTSIDESIKESPEHLEKEANAKKCTTIDKRNFLAHAGFERNSIAVVDVKGEVLVGYHPECLEKIQEIVKKI